MLFTIVATIGKIGVGLGANTVAMTVIKAMTPPAANTITKVCLKAGGLFLGAAVASAAMNEYDQTVKQVKTFGKAIATRLNNNKMETETEAE